MGLHTVLILPGWQGSGPDHWQMHWVRQHGGVLVEQDDWMRPRRGDWLARLDEMVIDTPGRLVLVGGCVAPHRAGGWCLVGGAGGCGKA